MVRSTVSTERCSRKAPSEISASMTHSRHDGEALLRDKERAGITETGTVIGKGSVGRGEASPEGSA
jgi:hypothetical protein